ncbi:hypothetical protein L204_106442 [Cryptococcus depauperatus]
MDESVTLAGEKAAARKQREGERKINSESNTTTIINATKDVAMKIKKKDNMRARASSMPLTQDSRWTSNSTMINNKITT